MVKRIFFKVENGLFALEETEGIVSVYDCGSQNQKVIYNAIHRAQAVNITHIDNLFISHYHKDHVNGLVRILSAFRVDRIILPMVPNLTRVYNYCTARSNYHYAAFILNPEEFIGENYPQTSVIIVNPSEDGRNDENRKVVELDAIANGTVLNGQFAVCKLRNWQYRIYNRKIMSDAELGIFMLHLGLPPDATTQDIIKSLRTKGADCLLASLRKVFSKSDLSKINDYSMVVWSGLTSDSYGCLYTGDYNAKKNMADLTMAYGQLIPSAEIIQIPHHGSCHNFHSNLCSQNGTHVISASPGPYNSSQIVNPNMVINTLLGNNYKEQDTRNFDISI